MMVFLILSGVTLIRLAMLALTLHKHKVLVFCQQIKPKLGIPNLPILI